MLRGLAALAVCCFHFRRESLFHGTFYQDIAIYGKLGVDVFFVISGFVIPYSLAVSGFTLQGAWAFWAARFLRLYPAYLAVTILAVGLWYLSMLLSGFRGTTQPALSLEKIFANLTMTCDFLDQNWYVVVAWTLAIEAQFYVLVALTFPLFVQGNRFVRHVTLLFWLAMPLVLGVGPTVFTWSALFGMGLLIFLRKSDFLNEKEFWIFLIVAIFSQWVVKDFTGAMVGLFTVLIIRFLPQIRCRSMMWIGYISYSLYLLHPLIGGRVMNLCERYPHSWPITLLSIPVALAASIIAAAFMFYFIENPSHKLSRFFKQSFRK